MRRLRRLVHRTSGGAIHSVIDWLVAIVVVLVCMFLLPFMLYVAGSPQ